MYVLEQRKAESTKIRAKYPERIPVSFRVSALIVPLCKNQWRTWAPKITGSSFNENFQDMRTFLQIGRFIKYYVIALFNEKARNSLKNGQFGECVWDQILVTSVDLQDLQPLNTMYIFISL